MEAQPQRVESNPKIEPRPEPRRRRRRLDLSLLRFVHLLRKALWRAFEHDAFAMAKASAYSLILTFFPALMVVGSVLATSHKTEVYLREISYAIGKALPAGS